MCFCCCFSNNPFSTCPAQRHEHPVLSPLFEHSFILFFFPPTPNGGYFFLPLISALLDTFKPADLFAVFCFFFYPFRGRGKKAWCRRTTRNKNYMIMRKYCSLHCGGLVLVCQYLQILILNLFLSIGNTQELFVQHVYIVTVEHETQLVKAVGQRATAAARC
jgi:hypothetical protein